MGANPLSGLKSPGAVPHPEKKGHLPVRRIESNKMKPPLMPTFMEALGGKSCKAKAGSKSLAG
jgi:hypothetical protein